MGHAVGPDIGDVLIGLTVLSIVVGGVIWLLISLWASRKKGRRVASAGAGIGLSDEDVDAVVVATVAATVAAVTTTVV
jgi:hypothetical protein